jgi:hypothetical protein
LNNRVIAQLNREIVEIGQLIVSSNDPMTQLPDAITQLRNYPIAQFPILGATHDCDEDLS